MTRTLSEGRRRKWYEAAPARDHVAKRPSFCLQTPYRQSGPNCPCVYPSCWCKPEKGE